MTARPFVKSWKSQLLQTVASDIEITSDPAAQDAIAAAKESPRLKQARAPGKSAQPVPDNIRDYEVLELIGRGGMGAVYKARHVRLGKIVALKVISDHLLRSPKAVQRFEREAKAIGRLEHPNVVRAIDAGEDAGRHFLITEYVDGKDLASRWPKDSERPSLEQACEIICQAAAGVQYLHENQIVHRDLKPSNLMLTGDGVVKVLDLGLARMVDDANADLTGSSDVMGTLAYMAPEQGQGSHAVDTRADIYSLAATLFYLLDGQPPLDRDAFDTPLRLAVAVAQKPRRSIRDSRPDLPEGLAELIDRQLSLDPAQRLSEPKELATALRPFCRGDEVTESSGLVQPLARENKSTTGRLVFTALAVIGVLFTIAAITVIIKNRDGKVVAEINAKEAASIEIKTDAAEANTTASIPEPPAEPPPLDEWLKGREIITVAQDGSGDHTTIQSALENVRDGQAIEILDAGPYRELLQSYKPGKSYGIFSRVGAKIELSRWTTVEEGSTRGHNLAARGLRLNGLTFVVSVPVKSALNKAIQALAIGSDATIEFCNFIRTAKVESRWRNSLLVGIQDDVAADINIRECVFINSQCGVYSTTRRFNNLFVRRNLFVGEDESLGLVVGPGEKGHAYLSHNVLYECGIELKGEPTAKYTVFQNSILSNNTPVRIRKETPGDVILFDNLLISNSLRSIYHADRADQELKASSRNWQMRGNVFASDQVPDSDLKISSSNSINPQPFRSTTVASPYFLCARDGISAGALPSTDHPAWFSELMSRRGQVKNQLVSRMAKQSTEDQFSSQGEPPDLEDWIKGRQRLTVAQDGSGDYSSIREATIAIKEGQYIEILDKGPYDESLSLVSPPADIGIVSRVGTTVRVKEFIDVPKMEHLAEWQHHAKQAHEVGQIHGLRLHGIDFQFRDQGRSVLMKVYPASGLVIEKCLMRPIEAAADAIHRRETVSLRIFLVDKGGDAPDPLVLRDNLFALEVMSYAYSEKSNILVTRNWFTRARKDEASLSVSTNTHGAARIEIGHNVFDGYLNSSGFVADSGQWTRDSRFMIHHNSFVGDLPFGFVYRHPNGAIPTAMFFQSNLFGLPDEASSVSLGDAWEVTSRNDEFMRRADKLWLRKGNAFTSHADGAGELPPAETDVVKEVQFMSTDAKDRNYLRLPADEEYAGALSPGPAPEEGDWFTRLLDRWNE